VTHADEDPVHRLQRELAEKAEKDRVEREQREKEEAARQAEAKAAAAAGKEEIGADVKKVTLPEGQAAAAPAAAEDPQIAKARAEQARLEAAHDMEEAQRKRHEGKSTLLFAVSNIKENKLVVEYEAAFKLANKQISVTDVTKRASLDAPRQDVTGVSMWWMEGRRSVIARVMLVCSHSSLYCAVAVAADFHADGLC
jgi:hypothetical protein